MLNIHIVYLQYAIQCASHTTSASWPELAVDLSKVAQSCSVLTERNGNIFIYSDLVILNESIILSMLTCRCLPRHFLNLVLWGLIFPMF